MMIAGNRMKYDIDTIFFRSKLQLIDCFFFLFINRFANLYKSPSRREMTVPFQITVEYIFLLEQILRLVLPYWQCETFPLKYKNNKSPGYYIEVFLVRFRAPFIRTLSTKSARQRPLAPALRDTLPPFHPFLYLGAIANCDENARNGIAS